MSVTLGIGGTGCLVNRYFYEQISEEHGLDPSSSTFSSGPSNIERRNLYFKESSINNGAYKPRSIFFDFDEAGINSAVGPLSSSSFFDPSNVHFSNKGSLYGLSSSARDSIYKPLFDSVNESIRKEIEACDSFKGLRVFTASGGGTGSGATEIILEDSNLSSKAYIFAISPDNYALPPPSMWLSSYNTLKLTNFLSNSVRGVFWYDWKSVSSMANNREIETFCPLEIPSYPFARQVNNDSNLMNLPYKFADLEANMMSLIQPGLEQLINFNDQRKKIQAALVKTKEETIKTLLEEKAEQDENESQASTDEEIEESGGRGELEDESGDEEGFDAKKLENHERVIKAMEETRLKYTPKLEEVDHTWDPLAELKLVTSDYASATNNSVNWLGKYLKAKQNSKTKKNSSSEVKDGEDRINVSRMIALSAASITVLERYRCSRFSSLDAVNSLQPVKNYNFFIPSLQTVTPPPDGLDDVCMNSKNFLADIDPKNGKYASLLAVYRGGNISFKDTNESLRQSYGCNLSRSHFTRWGAGGTRSELCNATIPRGSGLLSTVSVSSALDTRIDSLCNGFSEKVEKGFKYCIPSSEMGENNNKESSLKLIENIRMGYLRSKCEMK